MVTLAQGPGGQQLNWVVCPSCHRVLLWDLGREGAGQGAGLLSPTPAHQGIGTPGTIEKGIAEEHGLQSRVRVNSQQEYRVGRDSLRA